MGQGRSVARVAVLEQSQPELRPQDLRKGLHRTSHSPPEDLTAYYAAAMLKLSVELRRPEPGALDEVIARILEGTPVDREAFRGYVRRNFSLLRRT